jgi:hypothetical protein
MYDTPRTPKSPDGAVNVIDLRPACNPHFHSSTKHKDKHKHKHKHKYKYQPSKTTNTGCLLTPANNRPKAKTLTPAF